VREIGSVFKAKTSSKEAARKRTGNQNGQKQAYDAVGRHVKAWGIERNGEGWRAPLAPHKKTKSVRTEIVQDASSGEMEKAAGEYA